MIILIFFFILNAHIFQPVSHLNFHAKKDIFSVPIDNFWNIWIFAQKMMKITDLHFWGIFTHCAVCSLSFYIRIRYSWSSSFGVGVGEAGVVEDVVVWTVVVSGIEFLRKKLSKASWRARYSKDFRIAETKKRSLVTCFILLKNWPMFLPFW